MKILSPSQIAKADQYTITNEPISSVDLMERASLQCVEWLVNHYNCETPFLLFCGTGNNGGDGLAIARHLINKGFDVIVYIIKLGDSSSEDFEINLERLKSLDANIIYLENESLLPIIKSHHIIIDAIFGIGLNRTPQDNSKNVIEHINSFNNTVISIDIPSGLFANQNVINPSTVIKSNITLTFQNPKLAFFLPDDKNYIKKFVILDIGISKTYLKDISSKFNYYTYKNAKLDYKERLDKWSHKGSFGHSLIIGGSYGKIGAPTLSARAALKIGSGLVTTYIPQCGYSIVQTALPEVMVETDEEKFLKHFTTQIEATAVGIGPGMGTHRDTRKGFEEFIKSHSKPLVIDADALNCLSLNKELLRFLPKNSILTPHPKELERLIGTWKDDYHKLDKIQEFVNQYSIILVLKGAYTLIATSTTIYFNSTGNTALATAGSGDVLTGIITGLLAQGYSPLSASCLGVYIHGKTAELFAKDNAIETFSASTIIQYLSQVYLKLKAK